MDMIDRSKLSDNDLKSIEVFEGIKPFTITISKSEDALFLVEGMLMRLGAVNEELMAETLDLLARSIGELGVEDAVKMFFDTGQKEGKQFPEFMRPVFVHMFNHILEKKDR